MVHTIFLCSEMEATLFVKAIAMFIYFTTRYFLLAYLILCKKVVKILNCEDRHNSTLNSI